ncbi:MAG: chemotaxis protein CheR, partial [Gammaproteobacteria bacterium SG8_11]
MESEREFNFTQKDFKFIRDLIAEQTGIALSEAKTHMVYSRLSRRLRSLNIPTFAQYCDYLNNGPTDELVHFVNALTTNLTAFFRENHHFEFLAKTLLPNLFAKKESKRVRIWSAGCSTGEEPYSLAIVLHENMPRTGDWDIKILATDLDSNVVAKAAGGIYEENRLNGVSEQRMKRFFIKNRNTNQVKLKPEVRELITFKQLNLMHEWPMKGPFDFIFCRNVVIYFNKDTQKTLFKRFADLTVDKGYLFIGHSESLFKVSTQYQLIGN